MADFVELRMSVASLNRVDPYAKTILATSTHVALYKFNSTISEWERTETEGALFLYSRSGEPWHSIMIMNRLNTENLIEPIVKEFDYQLQPPFLLYRNSKNLIYGVWFYNKEECITTTCLIEKLMENLREKEAERPVKKENSVDIFSMLSKAQEDFNKTPVKHDVSVPQFASTPRAPDVTSKSVMDFFARASTKPVKSMTVGSHEEENLLQRLMSNPAHSVEHIEKQQRSITPQDQKIIHADRKSMPVPFSSPNKGSVPENGLSFLQRASPQVHGSSPLANFLMQGQAVSLDDGEHSPLANFLSETPQKQPQLMPPNMFISSSKNACDLSTGVKDTNKKIDLLTKNQLQQAFSYLLENDEEFMTKIHEAYVKSVNEKLNHVSLGALK